MKSTLKAQGIVYTLMLAALAGFAPSGARAVDTTPPTGTIVINNNRSATNTLNVLLALTWSDGVGGSGVSRMRFSDDGAHWTAWQALAASDTYALPVGPDGHRTVRVQFLDKANNSSAVCSDYILLDTAPPTGGITINSGAATTNSRSVTLGLTWADGSGSGVSRVRFSDDGAHWTAWEAPQATRPYTLPAGLGNHTVRAQYLDGAGNNSAVYSDYIKLAEPSAGASQTVLLPGNVSLVLKWIPSGEFTMGSPDNEQGRVANEQPQHLVTLPGFWMGKYSITKSQWKAVMGTSPWTGQAFELANGSSPASLVSWNDAKAFLTAVNSDTGKTFRLPSEAEREYAARAGTTTRFYWGDDPNGSMIGDYAWYADNAWSAGEQYAHIVGQKLPNAWGLYDMSGNVFEWCEDDYHPDYTGAPTGGQAWVDTPRGSNRTARGGSWYQLYTWARSADRVNPAPDVTDGQYGFRVVLTP